MPKKIVILVVGFILVAVVLAGVYTLISKKSIVQIAQNSSISSDILYITNPATTFTGKIEKIDGKTLTVSQDMTIAQPFAPPAAAQANQPSTTPVLPKTKKITYKVLITDNTLINQSPSIVPYLFRQETFASASANVRLSVQNLKIGQYVNINTNTDLRTLSGNQFEANSINLSDQISIINGKITDIKGSELTVLAFSSSTLGATIAMSAQPPKEKTFTVTIDQNTEISRFGIINTPNQMPKPEKYSLSDLKKDLSVMIYVNGDVATTDKVTGLKIEPIFPPPAATTQTPTAGTPPTTGAPSTAAPTTVSPSVISLPPGAKPLPQ